MGDTIAIIRKKVKDFNSDDCREALVLLGGILYL